MNRPFLIYCMVCTLPGSESREFDAAVFQQQFPNTQIEKITTIM